ncbi:MAG: SPFH domain-containing protein, partial [Candidatus Falkowbacteria bacterium]
MTTDEMRSNYVPSTDKIDGISILLTIAFSAVIGLLPVIPIAYFFGFWFGLLAFILVAGLTAAILFTAKIQKVPESYVWIIEFFGGFKVVWSAGGHMYFSLFNWLEHRAEVYLGEKHIELFPDPNDLIDLEDTSCHFKASIVIKVVNPLLAIYNIDDYKTAVRGRVAGLLRSHLSKYTLDKANEEKHELDLGYIISGDKYSPDWKEKKFYTEVLDDWGVELLKLVVSDLELSPKD